MMTTPDNVSSFQPEGPGKISKTLSTGTPAVRHQTGSQSEDASYQTRTRTCGVHICRDQRPAAAIKLIMES